MIDEISAFTLSLVKTLEFHLKNKDIFGPLKEEMYEKYIKLLLVKRLEAEIGPLEEQKQKENLRLEDERK